MAILTSGLLRVELDDGRPRVIRYVYEATGTVLPGAIGHLTGDDDLWIRTNEGIAGSREISVTPRAAADRVVYEVAVERSSGVITMELSFAVIDGALRVKIGSVTESGDLKLEAVDLTPLAMVSNSDPAWAICTSEWERVPFDEFHHGRRRSFDFAAFLRGDTAVALTCNRPLEPANLDWRQTFPEPGRWTPHHVMTFSVYRYRVGGEVQPEFEGWVGWFGDRNGDGVVDWQDVAHWVRSLGAPRIPEFYRDTWVVKISTASPPDRLHTTFDQCRELVCEFAARAHGTTPEGRPVLIVYLSGWQYEGHDSKWPAVGEVCRRCGTVDDARRLIEEARALGVNVSLHLNWDDMYADSPAFSPAIAAIGPDGELLKGATWGGGQAYYVCNALDVETGAARRRMRALLDLLPIRDTVHFDVLSSNTWTHSLDPARPISRLENIVRGKWKVIDMFRDEAGLDVTSEGYSRPFLGRIGYYWGIGDDYKERVKRYLLHGHAMYGGGGGSRDLSEVRRQIFNRASIGAGISQNLQADTPIDGVMDLYYLVFLPYRLLAGVEIRFMWEEGGRVGTTFEDGSEAWGDPATMQYEVRARDRLVAKDFTVFLPHEGRWIASSMDGTPVVYPAPEGWGDGPVPCHATDARDDQLDAAAEVWDGVIALTLPPHRGYLVGTEDDDRNDASSHS